MSIDRNTGGPQAAPSLDLFSWRGARRKSAVTALVLAAGAGAGVGGLSLSSGCQSIGPIIAPAVVRACIDIIRGLFNLPLLDLPPGFVPCDQPDRWEERGVVTQFCFYCSAADPYTMYMQLDCEGPFFPLKARPVGSPEPLTYDEAISLEKFTCEERFLRRAQSVYDGFHGRLQTSIKSPNNRMLPDPSAYPSLTVLVDGKRIIARTDFPVRFGETIELSGTVDEVAHYAMTAGVTELSFRDGNDRYEVVVNPRFSAKLVFKNGECVEKGLLFAPLP